MQTEALPELQTSRVDPDHKLLFLNPPGREQNAKVRPPVRIGDTPPPWLEAARGPYLVVYRGRRVRKIARAWRAGLGPEFVPTTWRHTLTTRFDEQGVADREIDDWF